MFYRCQKIKSILNSKNSNNYYQSRTI